MITKSTPELVPGDVVVSHGMRLLIEQAPSNRGHRQGAVSTDALVLNPDEVREHGLVPFSWLQRQDGSLRWHVQGNDLAKWAVVEEGAQS